MEEESTSQPSSALPTSDHPQSTENGNPSLDAATTSDPPARPSAAEELLQLIDVDKPSTEPTLKASSLAPHSVAASDSATSPPSLPPHPSATESMQSIVDEAMGHSAKSEASSNVPPSAPSPSALASESRHPSEAPASTPTAPEEPDVVAPPDAQESPASASMEHIVTLPLQASLRPLYDETLLKHRRDISHFGAIFRQDEFVEPSEALVNKIGHLLNQLRNICDYPQHAVGTVLEDLPPAQLARYSHDANAKFCFVSELLQGLKRPISILILARSLDLLRLLHHLASHLGIETVCQALDLRNPAPAEPSARVTLALPSETMDASEYDVVIVYDTFSRQSHALKSLHGDDDSKNRPLVLFLVTTHSIEHIDLCISPKLPPLARMNALLSGIVRARQLATEPERGRPEPHEAAALFLDFLNQEADSILWDPAEVPAEVLDMDESAEATKEPTPAADAPEPESGRKRKLDAPDEEEDVKRMRLLPGEEPAESTLEPDDPPLPDDITAMLAGVDPSQTSISSTKAQAKVSLAVLQALADKISEYERRLGAKDNELEYKSLISGLETRLKEYERTSKKMYESHRQALQDRTQYEKEKQKAEAALEAAAESAKREDEKARSRIADLETTLARLTSNGDESSTESPLARSERLLKEAQDKVQVMEKRLENSRKDEAYVRNLYQEATLSVSGMQSEIAELKAAKEKLTEKASDTARLIQQQQAETNTRHYLRQIGSLKTLVREREVELDRVREELRQVKNTRRETRQASVPRSPRMGMLSPRMARAPFGSRPASRGTSPASATGGEGGGQGLPPMQYMAQPSGSARWNHLRE